jgi:TonB-linked SusC/RagA family outer membrane protein
MRKFLILLTCLFFALMQLTAQNRSISGRVTDEKGTPIINASVLVKGTKFGTVTGADGLFTIAVSPKASKLVISSVDMVATEVAIGSEPVISVSLKRDNDLKEVVITGYSREKKSQFTGSAAVLSSKVVENTPVGSFDQVLQGRAPGMVVNSGSGQPGASANITIRGIKSISGAGVQPLYILDGVPIPPADFQGFNPNDFESITVLKDAGAAALYGARGALGVIVITSKKGKAGATNLTYRTQYGFTQAPSPSKFNMMNTQEALAYEEISGLAGAAVTGPGWAYSKKNPTYATQTPVVQARRDFLLDSFRNINPNYSNILFRQGISKTHEVNLSGGSDKTRFFVSAGLFDQQGTDLNSRLRRYSTRFNLDHTVGKLTFQFNNSAAFAFTNFNEGEWLGNSARNPFQIVWRAKPYENPYDAKGNPIFGTSTTTSPKVIGNALEGVQNSYWQDRQIKINSGLTLSYKLSPTITLKNVFGIDVGSELGLRSINANSYIGSLQTNNSGFHSEAYRIRSQIINTTGAIFSNKFDRHEVSVGTYFEIVRAWQRGLGFTLLNLDPRLPLTGQGAGPLPVGGATTYQQTASSAKSGFGIRSYFATGKYTYNNKYTVTGNVRRDGTSRIANEANKQITTWSAGFIWSAIKERFMASQNIFTDLSLRASYGEVPNIGSIATTPGGYVLPGNLYNITNYLGPQLLTFGTTPTPTTLAFAGSTITGQVPASPGTPNLRIERVEKTNLGIDFSLWKSRARFTVDVYSETTKDLFISLPLGSTSGFGGVNLPINAGTMSNKGVELSVNIDLVRTKDIDFTIGFNHAINKNTIEDLGPLNEYPTGTSIIRKGLSFGTHYTQNYLGADPATGRPLYEKEDGKTTTNINEAGLFAKFGTYLPKHVGGFTADFRVKRLSVSALFSYQFDVYRYNNIESWTTRGNSGFSNAVNQNRILLTEQWQKPGDVKFYTSPLYDRGFTSADVHDAKFLRFRTLSLTYQVPGVTIKGFNLIKGAKFYVQGQNLWIWSPWRGLDPEDNNNISLNEFPNPRMLVTGIDINF